MSDTALNAMKRTALVLFCLLLVVTLGLVFTRVVAARVPEQRATLEKLITDRTGGSVRLDIRKILVRDPAKARATATDAPANLFTTDWRTLAQSCSLLGSNTAHSVLRSIECST